ncbi:hypothetical protein ACFSJW_15540 [Flavobacterium artemisiae]|uniref:Uncharacterized protein n=1 Tax=Flavobacterium artemisiae TaxID=2126556 RepID=A0ABW4H8C4_9FLAO
MNLTNRKTILAIALLTIQISHAKNYNPPKNYCEEKNVTIKTESKSRYKYFFFRRTNHKKIKRIDKAVDQNGKIIIKIVMKSTEAGDQYLYKKFKRLVIIGNKIHQATAEIDQENGTLIIYNLCGEKISEQILNTGELYDKYRF